jgi:hypothetical protein
VLIIVAALPAQPSMIDTIGIVLFFMVSIVLKAANNSPPPLLICK